MTDSILESAKVKKKQLLERKADLRREREAVEAELRDVEKFIAQYEAFSRGEPDLFAESSTESPLESDKERRARTNPSKEDVAEAARVIIARAGRPVMRAQLFQEIREFGLIIDGKDPEMVLSTMLWRQKDKVVRLKKGGGYWLPERPWGPADYEPSEQALRLYEMREASKASLEAAVDMFRVLGGAQR